MKFCPVCDQSFEDTSRFCPSDGGLLVDAAAPYSGRVLLGQFELRDVIGRGAMGTVYRAWQAGMERDAAVKVLHEHLASDRDAVRRFMREARAVARLSHPNIVVMYALGELDDGVPFMAMEYVDGQPLEAALGQPLPAARCRHIVTQVAEALDAAHAVGIVHRDLKPANLILRPRGDDPDSVAVLDFGIAKMLPTEARNDDSHLTREGAIFGTPSYLAPEQASGADVDGRADLYSLGVILFRMLTGALPFDGAAMQVLVDHVNKAPPRVRDLAPDADPHLDAVVARLLAKDPADRFLDARALIHALEATADQATAPPPSAVVLEQTRVATRSQLAVGDGTSQAEPSFVRATTGNTGRVARPIVAEESAARHADGPGGADAGDSLVLPRPRRWLGFLSAALVFGVLGAGAAVGVYALRQSTEAPAPPTAAGDPPALEPPPPLPRPTVDGERRALLVSDAGYALRIEMPARVVVGVEYEVVFQVWNPDGRPMDAPEIIATVEEPGGVERGLSAKPVGSKGTYRFTRSYGEAGQHYLHILPPAGATNLKIPFEVVDENAPPDFRDDGGAAGAGTTGRGGGGGPAEGAAAERRAQDPGEQATREATRDSARGEQNKGGAVAVAKRPVASKRADFAKSAAEAEPAVKVEVAPASKPAAQPTSAVEPTPAAEPERPSEPAAQSTPAVEPEPAGEPKRAAEPEPEAGPDEARPAERGEPEPDIAPAAPTEADTAPAAPTEPDTAPAAPMEPSAEPEPAAKPVPAEMSDEDASAGSATAGDPVGAAVSAETTAVDGTPPDRPRPSVPPADILE